MAYKIITDTGCDIKRELLEKWDVDLLSLAFRFTDDDVLHTEDDMGVDAFYAEMRGGRVAKTSAINGETFKTEFAKYLKEGTDVLYIGFSSGLSSTYSSAYLAAEALRSEYPERKVITVDTLAASAGQGLIVYLATKARDEGKSIEELAEYVKEISPKVAHWVTVEDLVYLKRGGRVSSASAFFGNLLGIKPMIHVDDEGHLIPVAKVRGRRASLNYIVDKFGETVIDPTATIFLSHADCLADAEYVRDEIKKKYNADIELITDIGPVIGSHAGPGTVAFFFLAKER